MSENSKRTMQIFCCLHLLDNIYRVRFVLGYATGTSRDVVCLALHRKQFHKTGHQICTSCLQLGCFPLPPLPPMVRLLAFPFLSLHAHLTVTVCKALNVSTWIIDCIFAKFRLWPQNLTTTKRIRVQQSVTTAFRSLVHIFTTRSQLVAMYLKETRPTGSVAEYIH